MSNEDMVAIMKLCVVTVVVGVGLLVLIGWLS
jgi:hypothetical protein